MADGKSTPSVGELVAGNYQILGTAGSGGMGVVYRALDLKLRRTVALKFLPPDLDASERDKERFLREARTASSLDHPNIGVIYSIEETSDGRVFIAMAYYEGQSLAQRVRSGPLSPTPTVDIAIQILRGLEHAHSLGIEHRDIKPSNVVLTQQGASSGPTVKIVDFGLAHVSQQTASKTQSLSGTVAYMAPEQTLGRSIDCRVDIWAAGIVILEMLGGHNPFSRDTVPATIFAILNEGPQLPETVPPGLRQIVYRALSKDPARRYQSCSEMLVELEAIRADLPATVASGSVADASGLRKIRESSELRRSRESASASAWAITPPRNRWKPWVFSLGGVVAALAVVLLVPQMRERLFGLFTRAGDSGGGKPVAYEGYVAALGYMQRYDKPGNLDRAIAALQASLKADPLSALAYAQLGEAYRMKFQTERDPKWLEMALASCQHAEQLNNQLPAVYATLAHIHGMQGKHDLALQEYQQALELNPRDADALTGMARADEAAGKLQPAEEGYKKAIAVLPDDWRGYNELANFYAGQGKYQLAVAQYKQALELTPDNAQLYSNLGSAYLDSGDRKLLPNAEQALIQALSISPAYPVMANLAALYAEERNYSESVNFSKKALQIHDQDYIVWDTLRLAYEGLGDAANADATTQSETKLLENTVKLKPEDGMAQAVLADLYARDKQGDKSAARIGAALSLAPNDPQVLMEVADAYANSHDRARAQVYIQKAVKKGADVAAIEDDVELKGLKLDFDKEFPGK